MRCIEGYACCLPCPAAAYFYPPGRIDTIITSSFAIRIISVFFSLVVLISYLVLPDKRVHPRIIILFFSITMFLWQVSSIARPVHNGTNLSCVDNIRQSDQTNNVWCAIQGIMVHYTSICLACWEIIIIINLHLQTVWQSQVISRYYILVHIFCWIGPAIPVIIAYLKHSIKYTFGTLCLVSPEWSGALLFWPMVCVLGPAMFVHLFTTIWIMRAKSVISKRNSEAGPEWSGNGGHTRRWSGSGLQYSVNGGSVNGGGISPGQYSGTGFQFPGPGRQYSGQQYSSSGGEFSGSGRQYSGGGGPQYSGNGMQYSGNGMQYSGNGYSGNIHSSAIGGQYSVNDMQPYLGTYGLEDENRRLDREQRKRDAAVKIVGVAAVQWRILLLSVGKMVILLCYYSFHYHGGRQLNNIFTQTLPNEGTPFANWLWCVATGNSLDKCSDVIASAVPPLWRMIIADILLSFGGIQLFIVFFSRALIREWKETLEDYDCMGGNWWVGFRRGRSGSAGSRGGQTRSRSEGSGSSRGREPIPSTISTTPLFPGNRSKRASEATIPGMDRRRPSLFSDKQAMPMAIVGGTGDLSEANLYYQQDGRRDGRGRDRERRVGFNERERSAGSAYTSGPPAVINMDHYRKDGYGRDPPGTRQSAVKPRPGQ
ncbi:hypothetical protein HDV00_004434 [Rhizophlyctis rosea]|nr:hypothetical protein HDV00_004434 [Rhizophlyctis rosea]